jgi:hypothetical protein
VADRDIRPEAQGASIVVLGSLNPAIFQPQWFAANNLLRPEEADAADIKIVSNDVTVFSSEWLSAQVLGDRLTFETADPVKYHPLRDLAANTFSLLEHTPIKAFGFNRFQEHRMSSEEAWHAFGHRYAPKEPWKDILVKPGMRTVVMEGTRGDSEAERVQLKLEPSRTVQWGVRIHLNEHYAIPSDTAAPDAMLLLQNALDANWKPFLKFWSRASSQLLSPLGEDY